MPELSDAEVAELRQAHTLLKSLYADAGSGMEFRKLVKKVFPKASIPELEAVERTEVLGTELTKKVETETSAAKKMIEDFLADRKKEQEEAKVASFADTVAKVSKERGYTEDGKNKVLELMKDRGISKFEDAADLFDVRQPKPDRQPRTFSTRMPFVEADGKEDKDFEALMRDPDQWMADQLMTAVEADKANQDK